MPLNRFSAPTFLLLFLLTLALQFFDGAYSSEFSLESDEASHYVTGLMVRDYIAAGFPSRPIPYAENYYLHYPRVAFGHYPPMFYVVQASWTLPFGVSRMSIMLLMAVLTATLAMLVHAVVAKNHGPAAGMLIACLILLTPETQRAASSVMAESLLAVTSFVAMIYFARFLKSESWRDAGGFTLFAILAILTKGLALALAAIPVVAVIATRRWALLRKPAFWLPAVVVAITCTPVYQLLPATGIKTFSRTQGFRLAPWTIESLIPYEIRHVGIAVTALMIVGVLLWLRDALFGKPDLLQSVAGAALAGFLVFRIFVFAANEPRHAMMMAAPLAIFFASGAAWVAKRVRTGSTGLVIVFAIAVFFLTAFQLPRKPHHGFDVVASRLLATPTTAAEPVYLIASWGWEEGSFICEIAMREQRPKHYILRGYRVLVQRQRRTKAVLFQTTQDVEQYLDSIPVGVVILSVPPGKQFQPMQSLLQKTLDSLPGTWAKEPQRAGDDQIVVYSRLVPTHTTQPKIQLNMKDRLGKLLETP